MNKIWLDTSFSLRNKTGVGAYVLTLIKSLKLLNIIPEYQELILPNKFKFKFIFHILWFNTIFYIKTIFVKPDIVISPAFLMPYFTRKKTKYITVIHDLGHLRRNEMNKYNKFIFNLSTKIAIKKADIIITVSQTIKDEIIEKYNYPSDKIKVVYNAVGEHFIHAQYNDSLLTKYNIEPQKYILSVATLNKRKNIPTLIKAFEKISNNYPDIKLVLVGGMGNEDREKLTKHPNIIFTGYIKDEELPSLYKNALFYAYPSVYEGFGTPQIEAQYCGCPILASDIPVFREISQDSAEFCEPTIDDLSQKIEYLLYNEKKRKDLSNLGNENVKRFSIEKIAEQLKEVINEK